MRFFPFLLAVSLTFLACDSRISAGTADAESPLSARPGGKTFVTGTRLLKTEKALPGRYIVVLDDNAARQAPPQRLASELASLHGAKVGHVYSQLLPGFVATMTEADARRLSLDPRVRYVEEDGLITAASTQQSPPWNLDRIDQRDLPVDQSYSYNRTGSGVHVYVLDTGIWTPHAEFEGRARFEYDVASYSWNQGNPDCNGHGTHVAGIIGGKTYGVAKGVKLHAVRVLGCDGAGYVSDAIAGIAWVRANHLKPAVANMSLRASAEMDSLEEAITRAINAGITFVVAAGDSAGGSFSYGSDACYSSPARLPAAITVSATGSTDLRDSYANYGGCVDLFAPGTSIKSAWPGADYTQLQITQTASGSSMAAAHVAGAAALYLEGNPTATPEEVTNRLLSRATPDKVSGTQGAPNRLLYTPCPVLEATQPPQVSLTAPAAGAALSGTVTLTATATDDVGVTKVEFYAGTHLLGTDTSPPYEVTWDTTAASNGPNTVTVRAYDDSCGWTPSAPVEVTVQNAGNATFDAQWQVPACTSVGGRCDSVWLLEGRGPLGPELHAPNTLGGSCADGAERPDLPGPALQRLAVFRADGSAFAVGKEVTIQATVHATVGAEYLDLYSAADASNPVWTFLTTLYPSGVREQVLSTTFLLPQGGSVQAIRGVYRSGGNPQACNTGTSSDHDDLVFAVGQETDTVPPTVAITSPAAGVSVEGTVTVGVAASDNFGVASVELYDGTALVGIATRPPFSVQWNTKGRPNGSHRLTARAYDAVGLSTQSEPVDVIVNNDIVPPQVAFLTPAEGESVNNTVTLTANASDDRGGSVRVDYYYRYPSSFPASSYNYYLIGSSSTPPYSVYWYTRGNHRNGPIELVVRAYDQADNGVMTGPLTVVVDNDLTPPTVAVTSPAPGATVSGQVSLAATANDDRQISQVDFFVDGNWIGRSLSAPYTATWDSTVETNGSHTLTARATDGQYNSTMSTAITVNLSNRSGAAYDATLKAPVCTLTSDSCDSGKLLAGKGSSEPHTPNTLDGCADGTSGSMSIDRIRVSRPDGTNLAAGKRVRIDVRVWSSSPAQESLDLYTTSDAAHPSWTYLTTLEPGATGWQLLSAEYRLPSGGVQAVRANYRKTTTVSSCSAGTEHDHDDLVFTLADEPDTTPPFAQLTSPAEGTVLTGMATVTALASDDYDVTRVEFYEGTTLLGTDDTPPYSVSWNSWNTPNGSRSLTAVARDAAGNAGPSSPVTVTVNNDHASLLTTITSPTEGATVVGMVTLSATAGDPSKVTRVELYAGTRLLGTDYASPYGFGWNTDAEPTGPYALTTRAYDASGNVEVSAPVNVTVARDTTAPTVSLTSPAAGATVRGSVTVQASATDNTKVSRVEFYVDGALLGTSSYSPYSVSWSLGSVVNGNHTLTAKAYDPYGNVGTSPEVVVMVANDVAPPTVSVTSPAEGAAIRGSVTVTASAQDDTGVTKVELYDGATLLGTDTTAPYGVSWNTASAAEGTHTLTAKAYDGYGRTATSTAVSVVVDNTLPTASITAPTATYVQGTVQVTATASDNQSIARVELYDGTTLLGTATTAPYAVSWNTAGVVNGSHTLQARAYDAAGNVQVASRGVTVDNTAPSVAITSPANGVTLSALSLSATIQASASDNTGVAQVVFYDGGTVLGTDTTAPYSVSWNVLTAAKGKHTLTARATDVAGNVTTSVAISVTVQ